MKVNKNKSFHVKSHRSKKKLKKSSQNKSTVNIEDKKIQLCREWEHIKEESHKKKLTSTSIKKPPPLVVNMSSSTLVVMSSSTDKQPPLVVNMSSTDKAVPSLLKMKSNRNTLSQSNATCNISELISPKCSKLKNFKISKSRKDAVRSKRRRKCRFQVESVITTDPGNTKEDNNNFPFKLENIPIPTTSSVIGFTDDKVQFYEMDDSKVLLTIQQFCSAYFSGVLKVSILCGCIEVLGYIMEPNNNEYTVFSPHGTSILCLTNVNNATNQKNPTITELINLGMKKSSAVELLNKTECNTAFVVVRKGITQASLTTFTQFLERYCQFSPFTIQKTKGHPLSIENMLQCVFYNGTNSELRKEYSRVPEWIKIKEDLLNFSSEIKPKVVLCGGKAVGKSTLLRYFVNTMLKKYTKVLVIDCDIGQCEFTIPGCVSVVVVKQPLLGPNYTHFIKPKRSIFVGEVSVTECPERYLESMQYLFDYCNSKPDLKNIPWFVNTMGFSRGFGVMLTSCLIQRFGPTHLVQINSKDHGRNFPSWLTAEVVDKQYTGIFARPYDTLKYKFYIVPSGAEYKDKYSKGQWGVTPSLARNTVILSYLAQMLNPPVVNLNEVVPHVVNISNLNLEVVQETTLPKNQMLAAMNGSLVALCNKSTNQSLPLCLGFGVVRGVDIRNDKLYMITPLNDEALQKVNCLVKGSSVSLPDTLYLQQENNVNGLVPYVSITSGRIPTRPPKKEYKPLNENLGTNIKAY